MFILAFACSGGPAWVRSAPGFPNPLDPASGYVTDERVVAAPLADFVVFVDDGPTSADDQDRLAVAWPALVDALADIGADAQVAVLDSSGLVATYADPADADFAVGTGGPADGQALATLLATFESGALAAFLRPGATLHTLVVTDRQDASSLEVDFDGWYAGLETTGAPTFSAVAVPGSAYEDLVTDTVLIDVRSAEWGLEALAPQTAERSQLAYLTALPIYSSIQVGVETRTGAYYSFIEGAPDSGDWSYDSAANAVRFLEYIPPAGATIRVTYAPAGR